MKKLKLNLQSLNAEVLTRSQLKQILGGVLPPGMATCAFYGSCIAYVGASTQSYDPDDEPVADNMQSVNDKWCGDHSCCTDVDCPGAAS